MSVKENNQSHKLFLPSAKSFRAMTLNVNNRSIFYSNVNVTKKITQTQLVKIIGHFRSIQTRFMRDIYSPFNNKYTAIKLTELLFQAVPS